MNSVIVSGKGFLEKISFDKEKLEKVFTWSPILVNAKLFNASSAKKLIERENLDAFAWKFKEQHPSQDLYEVKKEQSYNEEHPIYVAQKVWQIQNSDVDYLLGRIKPEDEYHSKEVAEQLAIEKNIELLNAYTDKISRIETSQDFILVDGGVMFEGTRDQFRDCFFDNATNEQITDWCKKEKVSLQINGRKIL